MRLFVILIFKEYVSDKNKTASLQDILEVLLNREWIPGEIFVEISVHVVNNIRL